MSDFRYILRYLIDPAFHSQDRLDELVRLCRDSDIAEVMLLVCAEELSAGHPTTEEIAPWIALARKIRDRLQIDGISMSLNPWSTIFHNQRGRHLREGQKFRLMVGENGVRSSITVCPLCPEWQEYITALFQRFAVEINPSAIWIEDDWRLHNHDRKALGWGGCFCEAHLARFSSLVGESVSREHLLEAALRPGTPHPWRNVWMELNRATLEEPLIRVCSTLHSISMRIGIMTSDPDQHSIEGRSWSRLAEITGGESFLLRPHLAPYTQTFALATPPAVTRHTIANVTGAREIYPELENSPRCGLYSKSGRFTRWQTVQAALYGSRGITINHFDMLGNGTALDPEFGPALKAAKPLLDALAKLNMDDREAEGVSVLFDPEIARHFEFCSPVQSWGNLDPQSSMWSQVFSILGISHRFETNPSRPGQIYAVSGQTLRGYSDEQIAALLKSSVLLDALSVDILIERGYGRNIGVEGACWTSLQASAYSYESIHEDDVAVYGLSNPRLCAQRCSDRLLNMQPLSGAEILSTIHTARHRPLLPGALAYQNSQGGHMVSLCYPLRNEAQFFMAFFNVFRRKFLQRLISRMAPNAKVAMLDRDAMLAYRVNTPNGLLLAALNASDDPIAELVWDLHGIEVSGCTCKHLTPTGVWQPIIIQQIPMPDASPQRIAIECPVPPLDAAIFLLS